MFSAILKHYQFITKFLCVFFHILPGKSCFCSFGFWRATLVVLLKILTEKLLKLFYLFNSYAGCDELIWVKTNQLQRLIRTGRTGHWLNHGKEHCLVTFKSLYLHSIDLHLCHNQMHCRSSGWREGRV